MTSPASPPNRRRRRIVEAVAALMLVSAVSWWYWPRGDSRFVGKWNVEYASGEKWVKTLTFQPNGVVIAGFATGAGSSWTGGPTVSTIWTIRNSKLQLGFQSVDRWQWLNTVSHTIVERVSGSPADLIKEELTIETVTPEVIQLLPLDDNGNRGTRMTLRRIPE